MTVNETQQSPATPSPHHALIDNMLANSCLPTPLTETAAPPLLCISALLH